MIRGDAAKCLIVAPGKLPRFRCNGVNGSRVIIRNDRLNALMLKDRTNPASPPFVLLPNCGSDFARPGEKPGSWSSLAHQQITRRQDTIFRLFVVALVLVGGLILVAILFTFGPLTTSQLADDVQATSAARVLTSRLAATLQAAYWLPISAVHGLLSAHLRIERRNERGLMTRQRVRAAAGVRRLAHGSRRRNVGRDPPIGWAVWGAKSGSNSKLQPQ